MLFRSPWAAWVAEEKAVPLAYIRKAKKGYGAGKQIEGSDVNQKTVLIIEDLISTGGSSISAVESTRNEGGIVHNIAAIFSYGFKKSQSNFTDNSCELHVLADFNSLMTAAKSEGYITEAEAVELESWHQQN